MTDNVERLLEETGAAPTPAVDPAFAAALERRLLAAAADPSPETPPYVPRPVVARVDGGEVDSHGRSANAARRPHERGRATPWRPLVAAAAFAAFIGVALMTIGAWPTEEPAIPVNATSSAGEAPAPTTPPPPRSIAPRPAPEPTTTTTRLPAPEEPTTRTTATTVAVPAQSQPTQPASEPSPSTVQPRSDPPVAPSSMRLAATSRDGGVVLQWTPYDGRRFAAYVVLRADSPAEPAYPPDRMTVVIARIPDRAHTAYGDRRPGSAEPVYRVVAVDAERRELARSNAVRISMR